MIGTISHTDLIINPDGSIYHLHLLPEDIAGTILLVGDPGRVEQVADHFDLVELRKENREFVTCTGKYRGKRFSVISTGIGTDNIDIVINELDALVNVDLKRREVLDSHRKLRFIRLGTSGALHEDIPVGSFLLSEIAGGLDNLYHYYKAPTGTDIPKLTEAFMQHCSWKEELSSPYFIPCSQELKSMISDESFISGITLSTPGFYGPQVRRIRLSPFDTELIEKLGSFTFKGQRICNFEMECSALYALSSLLDHEALTLCVAIANRRNLKFLDSYRNKVDELIAHTLDKLANDE